RRRPRQAKLGRQARGQRALAATLGGSPWRSGGDAAERSAPTALGAEYRRAAGGRPSSTGRLVGAPAPCSPPPTTRATAAADLPDVDRQPCDCARHLAAAALFPNTHFSRSRLP